MFITYAQEREDVLLHRALRHVHHSKGFYIDVGAYHPTNDSVTRHFYDHGWRGINIEPARHLMEAFLRERPEDLNLQVAISDKPGDLTFYDLDGQLSTLERGVAERHQASGWSVSEYIVPTMTLTQICEQHVSRNFHFLKVDVEGHEEAALRGMDFARFRPWILVLESKAPMQSEVSTHQEWEHLVTSAGYRHVHSHISNRYYIAEEHPSLAPHFAVGVDNFVPAGIIRERDDARKQVQALQDELKRVREALPA